MLHLTRHLIALRRREPALRLGSLRFLEAPDPVLAFERRQGDDVLTCVFNLGHARIDWVPDGGFAVIGSVNHDAGTPGLAPLSGLIGRRLPFRSGATAHGL